MNVTQSLMRPARSMASTLFLAVVGCVLSCTDATAGARPITPSQQRLADLTAHPKLDSSWKEARDRAVSKVIDPDDYECGPTDFDTWFEVKLGSIQNLDAFLDIVVNYGALDWAAYYTLVFDHNEKDEYIGANGSETRELRKRQKDLQRFWDVNTRDVLLQGMHGHVIADDAKMVPLVEFLFGVDKATSQSIVDYVQGVITMDPGLGFDSPLFTLNAFAFSGRTEPPGSPFKSLPDKIVMGDGILELLVDLGLDANAPDYVYAHEYGHQVQLRLGIYDAVVAPADLPEFTRRTELMADALGAYYCAHPQGAGFHAKRISEVYRAAYLVGDCAFSNPGHHGTPNQREDAAQWGAGVAELCHKRGWVLPSRAFVRLFDQQLPVLLAPDAP